MAAKLEFANQEDKKEEIVQVTLAMKWMARVMGRQQPYASPATFLAAIRNGIELCQLLNAIKPNHIAQVSFDSSKDHVELFIRGCIRLGVDSRNCITARSHIPLSQLQSTSKQYVCDTIAKHIRTSLDWFAPLGVESVRGV